MACHRSIECESHFRVHDQCRHWHRNPLETSLDESKVLMKILAGFRSKMSSDEDHVLFKDRSDWRDVKPLDIEQYPDSVVKIAYSESFKDCYGYLRAVLKSGELSERVFDVSTMSNIFFTDPIIDFDDSQTM